MKKQYIVLFFIGVILLFNSCDKYDPLYPAVDSEGSLNYYERTLAYVYNNNIYITDNILKYHKRLTNTSITYKKSIAFSPKHDKIAYLTASGVPTVIDTMGNLIASLNQYSSADDIRWHSNNGDPTLVILRNNSFEFYGTSLSLDPIPFDFAFPTNSMVKEIDAFDISEDLDIVFSYRYTIPSGSSYEYYNGIGFNYADGTADVNLYYHDNYASYTTAYNTLPYAYFFWLRYDNISNIAYMAAKKNNSPTYNSASCNPNASISFASSYGSYNSFNHKIDKEQVMSGANTIIKKIPNGTILPPNYTNSITHNFNNNYLNCFDWQP